METRVLVHIVIVRRDRRSRSRGKTIRLVQPMPSPSLQCHAANTTYDPITHPFQARVFTHASPFKHACAPFQAQNPPGGPLRSLLPSLAWSGPGFIPGGGELACMNPRRRRRITSPSISPHCIIIYHHNHQTTTSNTTSTQRHAHTITTQTQGHYTANTRTATHNTRSPS